LTAPDVAAQSGGLPGLILRLLRRVSRRRRVQLSLLLGLALVGTVTEVVSLGAVVPFVGILTQPEEVLKYPPIKTAAQMMGVSSPVGLVLPLTATFGLAALVAGIVRVLLLWFGIRLSSAVGLVPWVSRRSQPRP
jgi:hypothetical protein